MDAEFVRSVASVGDQVEIRLVSGDLLPGRLASLGEDRLVLDQGPDGQLVLTLGAVLFVRTVAAAGEQTPAPPTSPPRPADDPPADIDVSAPLAELAAMSVLPLRAPLTAPDPVRRDVVSITNSLGNAVKINELDPKYGRVRPLLLRAKGLVSRYPSAADLRYLAGVLALLVGEDRDARQSLTTAAEIGDDPEYLRLTAIACARTEETAAAVFALVDYFKSVPPKRTDPLWRILRQLSAGGSTRNVLDDIASEHARKLVGPAEPEPAPVRTPVPAAKPPVPRPTRIAPVRRVPTAKPETRTPENPYDKAKHLEHREKDLAGAQAAYRQAIKLGFKAESAVKDLAWLTKRVEGPHAALRVINVEFAGMVSPGDALDNILIDFYLSTQEYDAVIPLLERQARRTDINEGQRAHRTYQLAISKLSDGRECVEDWHRINQTRPSPAARRGLALALIQRANVDDYDEAERVLEGDVDEKSADIRRRIDEIRSGDYKDIDLREWATEILGEPDRLPLTPLVNFVMEHYSVSATKLRQQKEGEGKRPSYQDARRLADIGRQNRQHARELSADNYMSAAAITWESTKEEFAEFLTSGLTTVADVMLERQSPDAARELYLEALRASEGLDDPEALQDTWLALNRFVRSRDGRMVLLGGRPQKSRSNIAKALADQLKAHGENVFDLVTQLVSQTSLGGEIILEAVGKVDGLGRPARDYLRQQVDSPGGLGSAELLKNAWRRLAERWSQEQSQTIAQLSFLQDIDLSNDVLAVTIERIDQYLTGPHEQDQLYRVSTALQRLRDYLAEKSFEDREARLRRASETVKILQQEIRQAPTRFSVEAIWPVCEKILQLVSAATSDLHAQHKPEPELSLALNQATMDQSGRITVQIKVSNRAGAAPLESPTLMCADEELLDGKSLSDNLPVAIRGGDHHIQVMKIRVRSRIRDDGAFSLPVTLEYGARNLDRRESRETTLPVRLLNGDDFVPIVNPFQDGASGRVVDRPDMFIGRGELISRIYRHLDSALRPGNGVAIFGQKRAGKSSIRLHLTRRLITESGFIVVDLENIGDFAPEPGETSSRKLVAALLWKILERAQEAYRARAGDAVPVIPPEWTRRALLDDEQPMAVFIDLIQRFLDRFPPGQKPRLVVLIDEFQYFDQWIKSGLLSPSFMQSIKALIERRLFHLVIVGQDAVERLIAEHANVFGVFAKERVSYLEPKYAHILIDRPIQDPPTGSGQSRFRERAIDRIIELTGGSAFYIQKFCFELVEYMNEQRAPAVTEADIELVRELLLESMRWADFDNLETSGYTDLDKSDGPTYRRALQAVAVASRDGVASFDRVADQYTGATELRGLLDDLVLRDVVREEKGQYRIVVRLYQEWLLAQMLGDHPQNREGGGRGEQA